MPTTAEALASALQHHMAGELPRAEEVYRQVLQTEPRNAEAMHLLGVLTLNTNRRDEAIRLLETAVTIAPEVALYRGNLGSAYLTSNRFEEAREVLDETLRLSPDFADAHYNLAWVLYNLGRLDEAVASYQRSLQCNPQDARTHNNLGNLLFELGRLDEALVHLEHSLRIEPEFFRAHYNRALTWLRQGRLREGWKEYEWRWRCPDFHTRPFTQPQWDGSPLPDKTLLLHAEQGLGDTIQLIRYLPLARERCGRVIVEIQPPLVPIFQQSGIEGLYAQRSELPPFDVQLTMASLPLVFNTTLETIPRGVPYLQANPQLVERWRQSLSRYRGLKVGIAWQGSPTYREDRYRSISLSYFSPLADVPGVQLFSLQKGPGVDQIAMLRGQFHVVNLVGRLDEQSGPFIDSAAIMKNLDLVITSDSAVAHLAGALGVKVWLALRIGCDFRWLADRDDSPWYPTMRLFRQPKVRDWQQVFADMARELAKLV